MTNKIQKKQSNTMWGGRFEEGSEALMIAINSSIDFDKLLAKEDIEGSRAHVIMLAKQNIISQLDCDQILDGLGQIETEIKEGLFDYSQELEDIHLNIESRLKEIVGDAAGRLHTARSRNDQVAVDFRLWVRGQIDHAIENLKSLIVVLIGQAESGIDAPMPGYTHFQVAQPVTWGHHMMAYVEMFGRDLSRFDDLRRRMNECPLGAAALAGTGFPIDRDHTAHALGFDRPTANSLDSVADRDFALEFLSTSSIASGHLSRLSEELVVWSTSQFSFVRISDKWSTGSSIMPQKRNPDAAELIRAKVARINGAYVALSTVMKGLPLAYSKDMQEDKEPVFDAARSLSIALRAMCGMIEDMKPNFSQMRKEAVSGFSTATDLADWLVRELGLPFREAHHVTGAIVKMAEDQKKDLSELSLAQMQTVHADISEHVFDVLTVEASIASRSSYGGTAPEQVQRQIELWKGRLL